MAIPEKIGYPRGQFHIQRQQLQQVHSSCNYFDIASIFNLLFKFYAKYSVTIGEIYFSINWIIGNMIGGVPGERDGIVIRDKTVIF